MRRKVTVRGAERVQHGIDVDSQATGGTESIVASTEKEVGLKTALSTAKKLGEQIELLAVFCKVLPTSPVTDDFIASLLNLISRVDGAQLCRHVLRLACLARPAEGPRAVSRAWLAGIAADADATGLDTHKLQILQIISEDAQIRTFLLADSSVDSILLPLLRAATGPAGLAPLVAELTAASSDSTGKNASSFRASDRVVALTKLVCVLIGQPAVASAAGVPAGIEVTSVARTALAQCRQVLHLKDVRRDCHTAAAMAAAQCLVWLLCHDKKPVAPGVAEAASWFVHLVPCLAMVRALLAVCDVAVLSEDLGNGESLLSGPLYRPLIQGLACSSIPHRLFALHCTETWVAMARKAVQAKGGASLDMCGIGHAQDVMRCTLSNWTHPNKRLSGLAADVFCALPGLAKDVAAALAEGRHSKDAGALTEKSLLQVVLQQPERQASRYAALMRLLSAHATGVLTSSSLCSTLSARGVLASARATGTGKGMLEQAFDCIVSTSEPPAVPAAFLQSLLLATRRELEASVGLPVGSAAGSSMTWVRGARQGAAGAQTGNKGHSVKQRKTLRAATKDSRAQFLFALSSAGLGQHVSMVLDPDTTVSEDSVWDTVQDKVRKGTAAIDAAVQSGLLPSDLVEAAQDEVRHAAVYTCWAGLWLPRMARDLLHSSRDVRGRAAAYVCRLLAPFDGATGHNAVLLLTQGTGAEDDSPASVGDDLSTLRERRLAAVLTVAKTLRTAGWAVLPDEQPNDPTRVCHGLPPVLTRGLLELCLQCPDPELRVSVMDVVCCPQSTTCMPTALELDLAYRWLCDNMKCGHQEARKRGLKSMDFLAGRMMGSLTVTDRSLAEEDDKDRQARAQAEQHFPAWLQGLARACVANLYPGAPSDRASLPLELLDCLTRVFGIEAPAATSDAQGKEGKADRVLPSCLLSALHPVLATGSFVTCLVNLMVTGGGRTADLARGILGRMPRGRPLPGYETGPAVATVVSWALVLTESPRDSEASAGADVLRLVHRHYAAQLAWSFDMLAGTAQARDGEVSPQDRQEASRAFVVQLLRVLRLRAYAMADALAHVFGVQAGLPFPRPAGMPTKPAGPLLHGIVASIQAVLRDVDVSSVSSLEATVTSPAQCTAVADIEAGVATWRATLATCVQDIAALLPLALHVVAGTDEQDAGSGGPDAVAVSKSQPRGADGEEMTLTTAGRVDCKPGGPAFTQLSKLTGPVSNSVNQLTVDSDVLNPSAESYNYDGQDAVGDVLFTALGAKGGQGQEDGDADPQGSGAADTAHMLVVAAWLATRETVKALGHILTAMPAPSDTDACPDDPPAPVACTGRWLVTRSRIRTVGDMFLAALLRLKHIGSIANTAEAFQELCSHLLLCGDDQASLAELPAKWLEALLARLRGTQQFILRRSAGFGQAFLALLRSEPRGTAPVLLRSAMTQLLTTAVDPSSTAARAVVQELMVAINGEANEDGEASNEATGSSGLVGGSSPSDWSWRSQVHCLNILRLLFRDASLGEDTPAFAAAGIRAAVAGFASKAWAVRNSSMMLFAAVSERAVAAPSRLKVNLAALEAIESSNEDKGEPGVTSTSHFFGRYPSLHGFVLTELGLAVDLMEAGRDEHGAASASTPRALFPLLLLMTRLRYDAGYGDSHDAADFLPLFLRCRVARHAYVRRLAGLAMATAVSPAKAPQVIGQVIRDLQAKGEAVSTNELHGACLQLSALLTVAKSGPEPFLGTVTAGGLMAQLEGVVGPVVKARAVDLVTMEYLNALRHWGAQSAPAVELSSHSLAVSRESSVAATLGRPLLHGVAADSAVRHAVAELLQGGAAAASALQQLETMLRHPAETVRVPVASTLASCLVGQPTATLAGMFHGQTAVGNRVCSMVLSTLRDDTNTDVLRSAAQLLATLLQAAGGLAEVLSPAHLKVAQDAGLRAHDTLLDPTGRAHAVRLLAELARPSVTSATPSERDVHFVLMVSKRTAAGAGNLRAAQLRAACGEAIDRAGLLHCGLGLAVATGGNSTSASLAAACLPSVLAVLALLQDGDDEVREAGRAAVAGAVTQVTQTGAGPVAFQEAQTMLLAQLSPALSALLPSLHGNPLPITSSASGALLPVSSLGYCDENRAVVLLHVLALMGLTRMGGGEQEAWVACGTSLLGALLAEPRRRLASGYRQLLDLSKAASTTERQAPSPSSYSTTMLSRPAFTEDEPNDHAEAVLAGGLALATYKALGHGQSKGAARIQHACGAPDRSGRTLLDVASVVIQAAGDVDGSGLAVPLLLEAGPWLPYAGPDECPYGGLWPASRLAELVFSGDQA